jgi:hypothetical protein
MRVNERTVSINEYGTNMLKYKYDPLAVIEAKLAMTQRKDDCENNGTLDKSCAENPTKEDAMCEPVEISHPTNPSHGTGTQVAPATEWSSQEENTGVNVEVVDITTGKGGATQLSPNWEVIEEDSDREDTMEMETCTQKDSVCGGETQEHNTGVNKEMKENTIEEGGTT